MRLSLCLIAFIAFMLLMLPASANIYPTGNTLPWAGYNWVLKSGHGLAPSNNNWSASGNNIWVDDNGSLHMTIKKDVGNWNCTELISQHDYLYGKFTWKINESSPIFSYDKNSVLGLFTYADDRHEVDIESSRWQRDQNNLLLFTVQPYSVNSKGYLPSVNTSGKVTDQAGYDGHGITLSFDREPTYIDFNAWDNNGNLIACEHFTNVSAIPTNPQNIRMNFWLRAPPSNGQDLEVVIDSITVQAIPAPITVLPNMCTLREKSRI